MVILWSFLKVNIQTVNIFFFWGGGGGICGLFSFNFFWYDMICLIFVFV